VPFSSSSGPPKRVAVVPATFDPPTNGHLEVIRRASGLFDEVVVAVWASPSKHTLFDPDERRELVAAAIEEARLSNVRVSLFSGLVVELAREVGAVALVKGLRTVSDFDYELPMAHMNAQLAPEIATVAVFSSADYSFLSSTLLREVAKLGGDVSKWVPVSVAARLHRKLAQPPATPPDALDGQGSADRMGGFVVLEERVR
jgi:pantetheine-phosphate adenylyltransferase